MALGFHPRRQGDLGEAAAIEWLTRVGACVTFPLFHSPDYDLIADLGGRLLRVQVKTSTCKNLRTGHFTLQLATSGGNQSWTGLVRTFDPARVDFLFALVGDGRRWFIPSEEIEGRRGICLGGAKYSEFQVGQTAPIDHTNSGGSKLPAARGGAGVGEPGRSVKSVPKLLSGFDSHPPHFPPPSGGDLLSGEERHPIGRTRLSANHQLTIPLGPFESAELEVGDRFRVEAEGRGRVVITRIEEYAERHLGQLALPKERRE